MAGGLLVVAASAVLLFRGSPEGEREGTPSASATGPSSASPDPAAAGEAAKKPEPPKELMPMPGCWDGLLAMDQTLSMESFRTVLSRAVSGGDRFLAGYLQERLTELVGKEPARALQVLDWAEQAMPPELNILIEALKKTEAIQHASVVERLLKMGESKGGDLQHRGAAMDALETQRSLPPAAIQRMKAIALDETVDSVAWLATRTLGRVMTNEYERTGNFSTYWKELLDISGKSEDMAVRLLALEMPSYSDPLMDEGSMDRLAEIMRKDKERDVREMAAFRLAVTENPEKALEAYRQAFGQEQELCVRWAILRFAVRAAGEGALPLLEQFAAADPRLRQDYLDFKELYARGTKDFARIWLDKKEHHNCLVEEGAPH